METNMPRKLESALRKYEQDFFCEMLLKSEPLHYSAKVYYRTLRKIKKRQSAALSRSPIKALLISESYKQRGRFYANSYRIKKDHTPKKSTQSSKKMAILVAVALCALIMVSATKKPLTDFLIRTYEEYIEFIVRGEPQDAPKVIEKVYYNLIGNLPQGYYRENVYKTGFSVQAIWKNHENEKLILYQTLDSSIETIMGNIDDYEMMYVENVEIISVEKNGRRFYFWSFEGYDFEFSGSLAISEEEFLKMIQNLLKERD